MSRERLLTGLLGGLTAALVALTLGLVGTILARGLPEVGALLHEGGLGAAALGTVGLTLITALVSAPLGVATAIALTELGPPGRLARGLRLALGTLAGVPGVVWGLFGLVVFVQGLGLGPSLLAAGLTLGVFT
ncbi:phosphate ABC transporter, permease protein PstA, partial [Myxococcota bacterium]|nr:phosphate ABC transporter, permease protein PstA [Myxococcota bacterium]